MQTETHLYQGDVFKVLARLPEQSVHQIITSVPYWGLRDYAIDPASKHLEIGQEPTILHWVKTMVKLGRALRRVLRDDGTMWINFGDSYNSDRTRGSYGDQSDHGYSTHGEKRPTVHKMSKKCRVGQPERALIALIDDGWIYRDPIVWNPLDFTPPGSNIWEKTNPMPSSVEDRTTPAHEMIYMFSKKDHYFYDRLAILEAAKEGETRNSRSVWTIPTEASDVAHFATWPSELAKRMIQAGTSERGCCSVCAKPWKRQIERIKVKIDNGNRKRADAPGAEVSESSVFRTGEYYRYETIGWEASCACANAGPPVPATILDPFSGSGTTSLVAARFHRNSVGIDLSKEYMDMAKKRVSEEMPLFNHVVFKTLKEMNHAHASTVKTRSKRSLPVSDVPPYGSSADLGGHKKAGRKTPAGTRGCRGT